MPYKVKKGKGKKPYEIERLTDHKIVGRSKTPGKAYASIKHRMSGEKGRGRRRR